MKSRIAILLGSAFLGMCSPDSIERRDSYFKDDGEFYARSRMVIGKEREWADSKKISIGYHGIDLMVNPDLDHLKTMRHCVRIYVDEGNLAGIREVFLEAYFLACIPCRSGDVLTSYGDPIRDLQKALGDKQFASCLEKMRPEVQSAVFYLLYFTYWPMPGKNRDFDDQRETEEPCTFALSKKVARLKWPSDYERGNISFR